MAQFLNGVAACSSLIAGLMFWRSWRDTADRLFFWFALAFWMLAAHWFAISLLQPAQEARHFFFLIRLAGFIMILVAIVAKNRASR